MTTNNARTNRIAYRLVFLKPLDMEAVEETLLLAILAVECLHGESAVRLDVGYAINKIDRMVVLDASNDTSRAVARVFLGFCTHEFGEDSFAVAPLKRSSNQQARLDTQTPEAVA